MSSTSEPRRRSFLMRVLRMSPGPIVLVAVFGGALMAAGSSGHPDFGATAKDIGGVMLILSGLSFVTVLYAGVYLQVVEASRGMPGLRPVAEPEMNAESTAQLQVFTHSLTNLGFRFEEWFAMDDFDETHVGGWFNDQHQTAGLVLYYPAGRLFRLRFLRRYPNGAVLISSTRLVDVTIAPPQGMYLQAKPHASVEELWAWHLDADGLFPQPPSSEEQVTARELFVGAAERWSSHRRRDRTWLLAVEPVEELWRLCWLKGMPMKDQFERGWTTQCWE